MGLRIMPAKKFSLRNGVPAELKVSWKRAFKDTQVYCQDQLVCSFPERQLLEDGSHVLLPDGSDLDISLRRGELVLLHNGLPVPGSSTSAHQIVKHGAWSLYVMAFLTAVLGAYVVLTTEGMNYYTDSPMFVVCALLFAFCGHYLGKGKKAAGVFGLIISVFYIWFWVIFLSNNFSSIASLVFLAVNIFFIVKIIRAIPAINRFSLYITSE
jgi:hypothetical protein